MTSIVSQISEEDGLWSGGTTVGGKAPNHYPCVVPALSCSIQGLIDREDQRSNGTKDKGWMKKHKKRGPTLKSLNSHR